jgi:PAS domain-containing protein
VGGAGERGGHAGPVARLWAAARRPGHDGLPGSAIACDFLIHGAAVQPLSEPGRALLAGFPQAGGRLAALRAHLADDCPGIDADLEGLILYGVGFRHHCQRPDGATFEILGEPRGAAAFLSIRPATEQALALRGAETELRRAGDEARFLREVLDRAPVLAWSFGPDGQVGWANAAYRDRFAPPAGGLPDHRIPDAFGHVLEEVPLTARGGGARRRVAVPGLQDGEAHWFELTQRPGPGDGTLGFALEADDLVAAEASLRRFIETLTETFAHLPIGLAVFDKNRRLGLFNPALTDLVKIDAVWLAGRPSLRDFLERLRETRQMPEQKDFAAWRRKLGEIEEGARDGAYEENWVLPSGKIFRVTGRPHPQGALAFLFEDISTAIQLERRYRSELELSQGHARPHGRGGGRLRHLRDARLRQLSLRDPLGPRPDAAPRRPRRGRAHRPLAERCRPSPVWARLREFATSAEARSSWTDAVETREGRILQMLVAPLPDASALVVFRSLTEERAALAQLARRSTPALPPSPPPPSRTR